MVLFIYMNIFKIAGLKSLSSKFNIRASSGTASIVIFPPLFEPYFIDSLHGL